MIRQLSNYPPIPPNHPWFSVEQHRLRGVELWSGGKLDEAHAEFKQALAINLQHPHTWSTYHRFLLDARGQGGFPTDEVIALQPTPWSSQFAMFRFFGRCQVATAVKAGGVNGFETPCPIILAKWLHAVGGAFCDVGANSGYYSLLAAAAGSRVIAFEPFAPAADALRSNVELNDWSNRIEIRETAVSDRPCVTRFYLPLQLHGLLETSASQDPTFRAEHSFEFDVEAIALDSLLDELGPTEAITVKLDVEGIRPALAALRGAHRLVMERRPVMMVEYFEGPSDDLERFLADTSYRSFVGKPNGTMFVETKISPQPDQLNHFFVPSERAQEFVDTICK